MSRLMSHSAIKLVTVSIFTLGAFQADGHASAPDATPARQAVWLAPPLQNQAAAGEYSVAVHEAGHALVALLLPCSHPEFLTTIPDEVFVGRTKVAMDSAACGPQALLHEILIFAAAGEIAENIWYAWSGTGLTLDIAVAQMASLALAELLCGDMGDCDDDMPKLLMAAARMEAEALLAANQAALARLADAVHQRGVLEDTDISAAVFLQCERR